MTTETAAADTTTTATTESTETAITTSTPATEQAPGEGQGGGDAPAADAAAIVPDTYAFTLPEGLVLEGERAQATQAIFKELELTQDKAQRLVDFFVSMRSDADPQVEALIDERLAAKRDEQREAWGNETKAKFGEQFETVNSDVRVAFNAFKTPELEAALESEGWGNHPALVGFFAQVGRLIRDSNPKGMGGATHAGVDRSAPIADRLFGPKP